MKKLTKQQIFDLVKTKKESEQNITVADTNYYVDVFNRYQNNGLFAKWNWACFFAMLLGGAHFWFYYRKMYVQGTLVLLLASLTSYFIPFITLLWSICLGFYGNYIYLDFLKKKKAAGHNHVGTNILIPVLVTLLFMAVLGYLFYSKFQLLTAP